MTCFTSLFLTTNLPPRRHPCRASRPNRRVPVQPSPSKQNVGWGAPWSAGPWVCQRPIPKAKQSKKNQIAVASEVAALLQAWSDGLWSEPIQLLQDSGEAGDDEEEEVPTVPWHPPPARDGPAATATAETMIPDETQNDDMPGTDTEDEAWHLDRRRRSATAPQRPSDGPSEDGASPTVDGACMLLC